MSAPRRDTPTRRAHRIAEQLLSAWLSRGEPFDGCGCDGCDDRSKLAKALDKMAQRHFEQGQVDA